MKHVSIDRIFHVLRKVLPHYSNIRMVQVRLLDGVTQFDNTGEQVKDWQVMRVGLLFAVVPLRLEAVDTAVPGIQRIVQAALGDIMQELSLDGSPLALEFEAKVVLV